MIVMTGEQTQSSWEAPAGGVESEEAHRYLRLAIDHHSKYIPFPRNKDIHAPSQALGGDRRGRNVCGPHEPWPLLFTVE